MSPTQPEVYHGGPFDGQPVPLDKLSSVEVRLVHFVDGVYRPVIYRRVEGKLTFCHLLGCDVTKKE